ncbi:Uncharacterised protein [Serratia odorifera]|uniref:Uncharacterized protein n=1 Tax=Serratia odorifera TaxID=618 RepID=A0A3S4DLZ2_SEROD|nr:Uncharacterised protein [Serratia odorifera]
MSLNDTKIRSLKPSAKPSKVSDSHGLYLLVNLSNVFMSRSLSALGVYLK